MFTKLLSGDTSGLNTEAQKNWKKNESIRKQGLQDFNEWFENARNEAIAHIAANKESK